MHSYNTLYRCRYSAVLYLCKTLRPLNSRDQGQLKVSRRAVGHQVLSRTSKICQKPDIKHQTSRSVESHEMDGHTMLDCSGTRR
jgi:hypothetical protein